MGPDAIIFANIDQHTTCTTRRGSSRLAPQERGLLVDPALPIAKTLGSQPAR